MNVDLLSSGTDGRQVDQDNELSTPPSGENDGFNDSLVRSHDSHLNIFSEAAVMDGADQSERGTNNDDSFETLNSSNVGGADSTTRSRDGSFQSSARISSSFLSKLQSSTSSSSIGKANNNNNKSIDGDPPTNLPSSIANAFSSLTSSFASSFTLGNSSNGNAHISSGNLSSDVANNLTIETVSTSTGVSSQFSETREQILNKKATYERRNLINLTKLIVKDLISSSLSVGRTIDENHNAIHLKNYFTLIDRVLKHGLRQNILSNKSASLWNALDNLPKYLTDKRLTSETVRSLAHTKTPDGKIKAWLRIAMMQKKLPEYFNELLANKNVLLKDIYHDYAFMMNDEAHVFAGLIIGVNVIDCNFFVKDDNFDTMDDVIDLGPYLKAGNSFEEDEKQDAVGPQDRDLQLEKLTAVLDQKNYLEERSKHLESTIASLQSKIKQLEEQNSRLEIDAKVNEVRIQKLQKGESSSEKSSLAGSFQIPDALKGFMNPSTDSKKTEQVGTRDAPASSPSANSKSDAQTHSMIAPSDTPEKLAESLTPAGDNVDNSTPANNVESPIVDVQKYVLDDLERYQKLAADQEKELLGLRERVGILETSYRGALEKVRVLERDLDIQTSMNKDRETTIKIYEKDLRDRQSQVESLRASLADAKKTNMDLSERLEDTSAKLKERLSSVTNLQASLDKWKIENKTLATRLQDKQIALKSVNNELEKALLSVADLKKYNEKINDELRRERECGHSSSITVETQTTKINELTERLQSLDGELTELRSNKDQLEELKRRCQEYELSLEEVGYQLRESRLEVENLKENSSVFLDSQWMDSKQVKNCTLCQQGFSVTRRKHHCRLCGNVFCQTCSDNKMELASSSKPARVCDTCHAFLLAKFVKSSTSLTSIDTTNSNSTTNS